jgi:hypothetical protein
MGFSFGRPLPAQGELPGINQPGATLCEARRRAALLLVQSIEAKAARYGANERLGPSCAPGLLAGWKKGAERGSAARRAGRLEHQEAADAARGPERCGLVERGIDDGRDVSCRRVAGRHVRRRANALLLFVRLTTKMKVTHDKAPSR